LVGQQPNIKNVLASIEQQKHAINDIGSNLKPEIHANDPFQKQNSYAHSTKQESNKGETNCNWQNIFLGLSNEIKVRHYSPKTLKSYMI